MVPVSTLRLGLWLNNALQLWRSLVGQASQSTKTKDGVKKVQTIAWRTTKCKQKKKPNDSSQ
jgi:hypothetical protein